MAVNLALVVLRKREPDLSRPFRVPLEILGLPVLPILALIAAGVLASSFEPLVYVAGAITAVLSVGLYLLVHRRAR
jgi:amino acid transporter